MAHRDVKRHQQGHHVNLDKLNQWLTLLANTGVLLGIFLLVYELRQNNLSTAAQTRAEISSQTIQAMNSEMSDPYFYDAVVKYRVSAPLSAREDLTMSTAHQAKLRRRENMHYQYRQGLYSDTEFAANLQAWKSTLEERSYLRSFWIQYSSSFSEAFVREIDQLLEDIQMIHEESDDEA